MFRRRWLICALACTGLMWVQPGVSYYWLIDPHLHAQIDVERYGQLPDGRTLPGYPQHPPHEHPSSEGMPNLDAAPLLGFTAVDYDAISSEANRPSLQSGHLEAEVIDISAYLDPPEHPPRVPDCTFRVSTRINLCKEAQSCAQSCFGGR